ncbi:hypothetical protein FB645_004691 [Coemansia sp. IMI 203386]|nr:hypothetical protein FB645_004691 [Coemansia sp. IMI 203386]
MDTVALANHFCDNLYAQQEWPAEELNYFYVFRFILFNESCSGQADRYSVKNFNGTELPENSEILEEPHCNDAELGQERTLSNNYGDSANSSTVAVN